MSIHLFDGKRFFLLFPLLMLMLFLPGRHAAAENVKISDNSLLKVIVTGVDATSYIRGKDPTAYAPFRMIDGLEETSWQFSTKTSALKETYVYLSFPAGAQVDQLWIKNGFWKYTDGKDQYTRNSRVKGMHVAFRYSGSSQYTDRLSFTLNDDTARKDWQKLSLGRHENVTGIRLRINSIYSGTKYASDVCISELMAVAENEGLMDPSLYTAIDSGNVVPSSSNASGELYALATMKLATRSGPGTEYTEKGTYNVAGQRIRILAKYYDINHVCWVKCVIPYGGGNVTAWTGWKRFDPDSLQISLVPWAYAPFDIDGTLTGDASVGIHQTDSPELPGYISAESDMIGISVQDNSPIAGHLNEEDAMTNDETGMGQLIIGGGTLGEAERYTCSDPNGVLEILVRTVDRVEFQISIERLAFFEGLVAELDAEGKGTFRSEGDWNLSGTIQFTGNLILIELDDNPDVYFDMSVHEFIGRSQLVFLKDVLTVR